MNLSPSQAFRVSVRLRGPRQAAGMTFCLGSVPYPHTLMQSLLGLPVPVVAASSGGRGEVGPAALETRVPPCPTPGG